MLSPVTIVKTVVPVILRLGRRIGLIPNRGPETRKGCSLPLMKYLNWCKDLFNEPRKKGSYKNLPGIYHIMRLSEEDLEKEYLVRDKEKGE